MSIEFANADPAGVEALIKVVQFHERKMSEALGIPNSLILSGKDSSGVLDLEVYTYFQRVKLLNFCLNESRRAAISRRV